MSLRRFLAGPISFGLNTGLAVVAGSLVSWQASALPWLTLVSWAAALAIAAVTLKIGWPLLHTATAGLLLFASATATATVVWPLPLTGAVAALGLARFASVGFASRWLSRTVGLVGLALLGFAVYLYSQGDLRLGGDATDGLEALAGAVALVVVAVLGLWHGGEDEED